MLRSLDFAAGDEILINSQSYGAVRQAVRHVCERTGAKAVEPHVAIPITDPAKLVSAMSERTRLVIVDHISSPTASFGRLERIISAAKQRAIPVLVDGVMRRGNSSSIVPALGADWYTGNCHKWLFTPRGCAFLWARKDRQSELHPLAISHGYQHRGSAEEFDWPGTARLLAVARRDRRSTLLRGTGSGRGARATATILSSAPRSASRAPGVSHSLGPPRCTAR